MLKSCRTREHPLADESRHLVVEETDLRGFCNDRAWKPTGLGLPYRLVNWEKASKSMRTDICIFTRHFTRRVRKPNRRTLLRFTRWPPTPRLKDLPRRRRKFRNVLLPLYSLRPCVLIFRNRAKFITRIVRYLATKLSADERNANYERVSKG